MLKIMKTVISHPPSRRLVKLAAVVLITAPLPAALAQQSGFSADEFYRQGDAFSERVSGFFARLFKPGSQPTSYQQPAPRQPQATYAQPGNYRSPAPTGQQTYRYPQATTYGQQRPATAAGTWPNYAQPQAPNYRMAPPVKSSSSATTGSVVTKKNSTVSSKRKPVFSTSNKTNTSAVTSREKEPDSTSTDAPKESVVMAPTQTSNSSPYSYQSSEPDPLPKKSFSESSSASTSTPDSTSKVSSNQSFPPATPSKTPGRVISPYAPNKELDVKGLPSGSLALDPTTQKVFRVP